MKTVMIGCKTIENEIMLALEGNFDTIDKFIWIESGLHNVTDGLRSKLQETLDNLVDTSQVILAFGFCGNALAGIKTGDFELVFPRIDDCISLLLGSYKAKESITDKSGTYFLTRGWLQSDTNIYREYLNTEDKYGKEMAESLYSEILKGYKDLGIINTGAYDHAAFINETKKIAEKLNLKQKTIKGNVDYLKKLINMNWDEDEFVIVPRYSEIDLNMLKL